MSHLDALYRTVLVQDLADARHLGLIRSILGCVVVSKVPVSLPSICALLGIENDSGEWARDKIASVLLMDAHSVLRVIHPSFLDFLTNEDRSKEFFVDVGEHNWYLARGCLRMMNSKLRTNICRLTDQTVLNNEITDLELRLGEHVPEELAYSCRNIHSNEQDGCRPSRTTAYRGLLHNTLRNTLHRRPYALGSDVRS
jgi:hypothetical protein